MKKTFNFFFSRSKWFSDWTSFKKNPYHPLVSILGSPNFGKGVYIGAFSEVNAKDSEVSIGPYCDIASFVSINCADSHKVALEFSTKINRRRIVLEDHVFVGSHCVIKGGVKLGHHSVVAAGTIVDSCDVPPYSLIAGNPMVIKPGYYLHQGREP